MKQDFNPRARQKEVTRLVAKGRLQRASDTAEAYFGDQAPEAPDMFITASPCDLPEYYLS
jgi:hypothetical protein